MNKKELVTREMEFGGEPLTYLEDAEIIVSHSKRVFIPVKRLKEFANRRTELAKTGGRLACGMRYDSGAPCFIWEDDKDVHIECLHEPKESFNRKYIELIKIINQKKRNEESAG